MYVPFTLAISEFSVVSICSDNYSTVRICKGRVGMLALFDDPITLFALAALAALAYLRTVHRWRREEAGLPDEDDDPDSIDVTKIRS